MTRARVPGPPPSLSHPERIIHLVSTPTDAAREDATELAERQLREARDWLGGAEGRAAAQRVTRRFRIRDSSADDLLADTLSNFWLHLDRKGPVDPATNLPAYLSTVMRNLATDALNGRRTVQFDDDSPVIEDIPARTAVPVERDADLGAVRVAIDAVAEEPWAQAGAHAYITALAWPEAIPADHPVPRPEKGATRSEAALWVALWFAGKRDVLVAPGTANPAARQKRSRAARRIRDVIDQATATVFADRFRAEEASR